MNNTTILDQIREKYLAGGENPENYLKGLLYARPINYWDYVETDTLLSLQRPRTDFKDEEIFIMYHQVTELVLKMMLHEIKQLVSGDPDNAVCTDKINRLNRYTTMLITSFDVMRSGMDHDDYNRFRHTLTPASGFQSVQFRQIELYCTRPENLLNGEGRALAARGVPAEELFDFMYWKSAGLNRSTGKKTLTLRQFEEKYQDGLVQLARQIRGNTLEEKIAGRDVLSEELRAALREFDRLYNIEWPMVHLGTARHYLENKEGARAATGGSEWQKYLHPAFQQRKFFPSLWTGDELQNWGLETRS
ncbi:MAG: tryptophan 2,3-dioxygenase [Bacteroidia bacterium]|nr:tryptophan 2,3-dioxygenase [Bacteroidia bacterium]